MKIAYLLLVTMVTLCQAETTSHVVHVPLADGTKRVTFHLINNNDHVMTQINSSSHNVHLPTRTSTEISPTSQGIFSYLSQYAWQYKFRIILGMIGCSYGAVLAFQAFLQQKLLQQDQWSCWHQEIAYGDLLKMEPAQVASALFEQIKVHYGTDNSSDTVLEYVVNFMCETDNELSQLRRFITINESIHANGLTFLFSDQHANIKLAQDKIERLLYLKRILLQWLSDPKQGQTTA